MAAAARGAGGLTYTGPAEGGAGREGAGRWAGRSGGAGPDRGRAGWRGAGPAPAGAGGGASAEGLGLRALLAPGSARDAGGGARSSPRAWPGSPALSPSS